MRTFLAALLAIAAVASPARATDLSDLWWNAAESGWGVNVSHQASRLFLTFFIYGANGQPTWVVASDVPYQSTEANGDVVYAGALYETTGPWFGVPFNPGQVTTRQVGSVTFRATSVTTATLSYTVDGTPVTKAITRYTFRNNGAVLGNYFGGMVIDTTGCPLASNNGHFEGPVLLGISGSAAHVQVAIQMQNGSCTISGPYTQAGRMGRIQGTVTCSSGNSGSATVFEIEAGNSGLTARYNLAFINGCRDTGHFGGVRR